jgi:hypothetical protein
LLAAFQDYALGHPVKVGFRNLGFGFKVLFTVRVSFMVRVSSIFWVYVVSS